ncbi:MAG: hypothetical protein JWM03_259 [Rhodocyclales bacterium]|nr:hypothetical protein [Rhodocyclales bacterium]MDB5887387.1 hypothetical protein [Rhodocyclales bacterium]
MSEAARILGMPSATVRAWSCGYPYKSSTGGSRQFEPLITPADVKSKLLSFANLCELHVLSAIRKRHRVSLPKVRASLEFVQTKLNSARPLLDTQFRTNGIDLFVEHASTLLNVSSDGQQALRGDFERALSRIERDSSGTPIRLFPFTRVSGGDATRAVVVDPMLAFGRPIISGAGVKTDVIRSRFNAGDSIAEMAADYCVEAESIEEALRFEQLAA